MSLSVQVYDEPPEALEALLSSHMPYSLPLLRRLQFSKHKGLSSPAERFILVSDSANDAFTAAYLDVAGGPDTHMWLYSTLEDGNDDSKEDEYYRTQLDRLAQAAVDVAKQHGKPTLYPEGVLLGSLHTRVRRLLQDMGRLTARSSGYYDKWIFRAGELPGADVALPEGLRWDVPTYEDCETVVERADVPRTAEMLMRLPGFVIRSDDGAPVSWAFIGYDGSLVSLHCEESHRRRGLAKAVATKLLRRGTGLSAADDEWSSADVASSNAGSRAICKSLNGEIKWEVSWVLFHVSE